MNISTELEERYTAFCEKNNLDSIISIAEQVAYLDALGETRLLKTLNGIINPVVKPKAVKPTAEALEAAEPVEASVEALEASDTVETLEALESLETVETLEALEAATPIKNIKPTPSKTKKKQNRSELNLKVDTTPAVSVKNLFCANITRSMIANSKKSQSGYWQIGLDF